VNENIQNLKNSISKEKNHMNLEEEDVSQQLYGVDHSNCIRAN
jgi:hypothetical protein